MHIIDKDCRCSSWVHEAEIDLLDVVYLGNADDNIKEGVVLASFNAG